MVHEGEVAFHVLPHHYQFSASRGLGSEHQYDSITNSLKSPHSEDAYRFDDDQEVQKGESVKYKTLHIV